MPVLDGYAATRSIHTVAPGLPVIGLTAHALPDEKERCLAAGMVDHVIKPIDIRQLTNAILKATTHSNSLASGETRSIDMTPVTTRQTQASTDSIINWNAVYERFHGDEELVGRMIDLTLQSEENTASNIRQAANRHNYDSLSFTAHGLKSLAGYMELTQMQELAFQTEQAARTGQTEALELAGQLADSLESMLAALAAHSDKTIRIH